MISLKLDIHVHTTYSDSTVSINDLFKVLEQKKLDGAAITDHDTMMGVKEAAYNHNRLIFVPGEEISTKKGHLLALGINRTISQGLPLDETIYQIHEQEGLAIVPHPTFPFFGKISEKDFLNFQIDGVEVFSSMTPLGKYYLRRNLKLAKKLKLPIVAGSDSHFPETIGDAYTIVHTEDREISSIIKAIKKGKTKVKCYPSKMIYKIKMIPLKFKM